MNESGFAAFKKRYTFDQELIDDLFHYGYYEADFINENEYGAYRVSVIRHDKTNKLYWVYQYNGSVVELKELD
jgi:hypothetical protein